MRISVIAVIVAGLIWLAMAEAVADAEAPEQVELCAQCHGSEAPSPYPTVPTIHGLPLAVLDNALYDFRAAIRPCRKPDCGAAECPDLDFCTIAATLGDEDIDALAHWYASQPFAPVSQPWDPALAAVGRQLHEARCESCHGSGGARPTEEAGVLRGQPRAYLRLAMEDFRHDRRVAVAEMDVLLRELTDHELDALVEFYASPAGR